MSNRNRCIFLNGPDPNPCGCHQSFKLLYLFKHLNSTNSFNSYGGICWTLNAMKLWTSRLTNSFEFHQYLSSSFEINFSLFITRNWKIVVIPQLLNSLKLCLSVLLNDSLEHPYFKKSYETCKIASLRIYKNFHEKLRIDYFNSGNLFTFRNGSWATDSVQSRTQHRTGEEILLFALTCEGRCRVRSRGYRTSEHRTTIRSCSEHEE